MATKTKAQIHMDDKILDNPELLRLLEDRQELKRGVSEYRAMDKKAKAMIATIQTPTPYRVGRFIISIQSVSAKSVSFDTAAGSHFTIKTIDED